MNQIFIPSLAEIPQEQHEHFTLYCADRPKPPNPSYMQTVQNRPGNSQFVGLSFTGITSFFYINQPGQTADLSSM